MEPRWAGHREVVSWSHWAGLNTLIISTFRAQRETFTTLLNWMESIWEIQALCAVGWSRRCRSRRSCWSNESLYSFYFHKFSVPKSSSWCSHSTSTSSCWWKLSGFHRALCSWSRRSLGFSLVNFCEPIATYVLDIDSTKLFGDDSDQRVDFSVRIAALGIEVVEVKSPDESSAVVLLFDPGHLKLFLEKFAPMNFIPCWWRIAGRHIRTIDLLGRDKALEKLCPSTAEHQWQAFRKTELRT